MDHGTRYLSLGCDLSRGPAATRALIAGSLSAETFWRDLALPCAAAGHSWHHFIVQESQSTLLRGLTLAVAAIGAYLGGILVLATADAISNVLEGDRYAMAVFLGVLALAVIAGAAATAWVARRDAHSWWRAARRSSLVVIFGSVAVALIHVSLATPF